MGLKILRSSGTVYTVPPANSVNLKGTISQKKNPKKLGTSEYRSSLILLLFTI